MRWRQVILLYLVLAALAAEYVLVERHEPPAPTAPVRQRFLSVRAEEVQEVRLVRGGRRVVSRRADGAWAVVEPVGAAIPPDLIAAFADALTAAVKIEAMGPGDDGGAFGLDPDAARIELITQTGEPVTVIIGTTNVTGTGVYARHGDAGEIVLIGRNVRYYEDLIFQALPPPAVIPAERGSPRVGG